MKKSVFLVLIALLSSIGIGVAGTFLVKSMETQSETKFKVAVKSANNLSEKLTFNKHIAPIIFNNCSSCHRPGQSAPFNLLTYTDVKKRIPQIVQVTHSRYMPPWLPEPGFGDFEGARRLTDEQIEAIKRWSDEGKVEGIAADLPNLPKWSQAWQLGKPDLVVRMPEEYTLPADGKDIYRSFVIPVPLSETKYITAMEFKPGSKAVHHAFVRLDETPNSRRLDLLEPGPGFGGMDSPETALSPNGHFLSWQPGKTTTRISEDLSWELKKSSDLVVQMHMQPTGKSEKIQPLIGFYYSSKPPTRSMLKISLQSYDIDIPAGVKNYVIKDSYKLPVSVNLLGVLPHVHYLGKELQGYAVLPDGTRKWLLRIKEWDFNWQGDYRFADSVYLPQGTTLHMEYAYDNSTENIRNPHIPPKRVRFGMQTSDEMGELWFQALPGNQSDFQTLARDLDNRVMKDIFKYNQYRLRTNPNDAMAHNHMGKVLMAQKNAPEAIKHLRLAIKYKPDLDEAHYNLGLLLRMTGNLTEAKREFANALKSNPLLYKAHGNLGLIFIEERKHDLAEVHFKKALLIKPDDPISRENLTNLTRSRGN